MTHIITACYLYICTTYVCEASCTCMYRTLVLLESAATTSVLPVYCTGSHQQQHFSQSLIHT